MEVPEMAHARADVGPAIAGTRRNLMSIKLPHKWWQWVIAATLAIIIVFTGLFLLGMHTGRLGFVPVQGNSMQSVFPWGTAVFVVPVTPKDGDYVVARVKGEDSPETPEDRRPGLIVKKLKDELLVSTDWNGVYGDFELRGVVIGQLPVHKVLWWMDKGTVPKPTFVTGQSELTRRKVWGDVSQKVRDDLLAKIPANVEPVGVIFTEDSGRTIAVTDKLPPMGSIFFCRAGIGHIIAAEQTKEESPLGGGQVIKLDLDEPISPEYMGSGYIASAVKDEDKAMECIKAFIKS